MEKLQHLEELIVELENLENSYFPLVKTPALRQIIVIHRTDENFFDHQDGPPDVEKEWKDQVRLGFPSFTQKIKELPVFCNNLANDIGSINILEGNDLHHYFYEVLIIVQFFL